MPITLTASDRSALIRLAASMDKGSPERKAILAGLQKVSATLTPDMEEAVLTGNPHGFAVLLDAKYGDGADSILDDMGGQLRETLEGAGLQVGTFQRDVSNALWKLTSDRGRAEIASSPWQKELGVLKDVTTTTITPSDVRKLKYQPKVKNGVVVYAIIEDMGGYLGNFRVSVGEQDAVQGGTTLKRVFMCLDSLGAKSVTRGMGPGKPKPWVDYDGWAY